MLATTAEQEPGSDDRSPLLERAPATGHERDRARDAWFAAQGNTVIRATDTQIDGTPMQVVARLAATLSR